MFYVQCKECGDVVPANDRCCETCGEPLVKRDVKKDKEPSCEAVPG